jgi:UDP-GlcNAc:undecaprenyl-phosphate GlcNAc-1-phosphate transferase
LPHDLVTTLLAAGLAAGVVTSVLVPLVLRLAVAARVVDGEAGGAVPRLGGVALFLGVAVAGAVAIIARWPLWSRVLVREQLLALAVGAAIVFLIGVADDLLGAPPWQKLIVQFLAAWLVVSVGWTFESVRLPFAGEVVLGVWGPIVSIVWVVGVTNAFNLIDGLDGLAGGVAAIIAFSLLAWALVLGNQGTAILFAAVTGACLGFLWHNWEPARIYLGDSGSLTLGFLFGAVSLHSSLKAPAAVAILVPILALGLPVIDTLLVMLFRFARGRGSGVVHRSARVFRADRSHLHHLLGHVVIRRGRIVVLLYGIVALFCAGALAVAFTGELGYGLALLGFEVGVVVVMRRLGLAADAARLAMEQREEARRTLALWQPPGDPLTAGEPELVIPTES